MQPEADGQSSGYQPKRHGIGCQPLQLLRVWEITRNQHMRQKKRECCMEHVQT